MRREGKQEHSLAWWAGIVLTSIALAFSLVLFLFSFFTTRELIAFEKSREQDLLNLTVRNSDLTVAALERGLYQIFRNLQDVQTMETTESETQRFLARQSIANAFTSILSWSDSSGFLFLSGPGFESDFFIQTGGSGFPVSSLEGLKQSVQTQLDKAKGRGSGFIRLAEGKNAYFRYFRIRNSFAGICLPAEEILGDMIRASGLSESGVFLADGEGVVRAGTPGFPEQVDYARNQEQISLPSGKYLQLTSASENGDYAIGSWTNARFFYRQLLPAQLPTLALFLAVVLLLGGLGLMIVHAFVRPVSTMMKNMERLGAGEWDLPAAPKGRIREFNRLQSSFRKMTGEVRQLKIYSYEKELDVQKANLQYLQLQIHPHFYLNVLNMIYAMAEVKDFAKIQEITLALVKYSRYSFRKATDLVTVEEEMELVDNYLRIQQIRFPHRISIRKAISPEVDDALIPPFAIQSFVENSVKYAVQPDQEMSLEISGRIAEAGEDLFVEIEIRDNGEGYDEKVLRQMHADGWSPDRKGRYIGINNVMQRLNLTFGSRATLFLRNEEGACTVMMIPLTWREEETDEDAGSAARG